MLASLCLLVVLALWKTEVLGRKDSLKAPFLYFGTKYDAAPTVWQAFGDVVHYVEPFAGSLAVLLGRPHVPNRNGYLETVNDLECLIVNAWRAIRSAPHEVAEHASWPVTEADLKARSCALQKWRKSNSASKIGGDPEWYDAKMAGWWVWCVCCSIGLAADITNGGPFYPDREGHLRKLSKKSRKGRGVSSGRPALVDVYIIELRNIGVNKNSGDPNDFVLPRLIKWLEYLSARLRHVRILNGTWSRVCRKGTLSTFKTRMGQGTIGIFLDPPYGDVGRAGLYGATEDFSVAGEVRKWCLENGNNELYRIAYAGFDVEGSELEEAGWRSVEWHTGSMLSRGMGNTKKDKSKGQQRRERLWLSPHCLKPQKKKRKGFFDET